MANQARFTEPEAQDYRIHIIGRNVYVTDAMKNHALDKLSKIDRFHNHILDIHVTMDIQKLEHSVIILMKFSHFYIKVSASSTDMYASIDKAVEKLQAQLRRWKNKIQDHHKKGVAAVDMQINVLHRPYTDLDEVNAEIENENRKHASDKYTPPKIIGNDKRPLKTLTTDEAIMKMELSGDTFLIFRGEEDLKLKVIYRRADGHYGVIRPE
jgi:putative sigma-54 modulation protein